ncbi:hypothetical protein B0J14DRAFT_89832 [Halenospora varia]|nr:hypothetical protein B0J14DRAFT_89832 [Halenospora varia]
MTSKRKRKRPGNAFEGGAKRQKVSNIVNGNGNGDSNGNATSRDSVVKQALLARYYPRVFTLREYLLSKLPNTSKIRRKKIVCVGRGKSLDCEVADQELSVLLDQTLIGELACKEGGREHRWRQWTAYSQRIDDSTSTIANVSSLSGGYSQSEIVDFAIWSLFSKGNAPHGRVQHLLCQGFRKDISSRAVIRGENHTSGIPGVVATHPNHHIATMKAPPWSQVLNLLGKEGEKLMIDLILDCGIFIEVGKGCGIYHQLSGTPLGDLQTLSDTQSEALVEGKDVVDPEKHRPSSITFIRNRMLYARAALNAQGGVHFGLRHIHVLNRCLLEASGRSGSAEEPLVDTVEFHAQTSTIHVLIPSSH